jgi:hemoglobin-like flavoprotein
MFGDLLKLLIADLSNADTAVAALKATATRHGKYGVVEAHFPVVGAALLTSLERCLGPAFTPATKEAWAELWATATNVSVKRSRTPSFLIWGTNRTSSFLVWLG